MLARIFGSRRDRDALVPLYAAVVAAAREPCWYREGAVPDTLDGRFDMVAALLSLVLIRLETLGEAGRRSAVLLTEIFVDDMDGTLRQIGIGDFVVGKHVGRMMGALGGRIAAFRSALAGDEGLGAAVSRNIFRGSPPSPVAAAFVTARLAGFDGALGTSSEERLMRGELPRP